MRQKALTTSASPQPPDVRPTPSSVKGAAVIKSCNVIKGKCTTNGIRSRVTAGHHRDRCSFCRVCLDFATAKKRKFKGCNSLKKKINPTRVRIEEKESKESIRWPTNLRQSTNLLDAPERCVHVADCEGDMYELFCEAREANTHFLILLIRICVDRLACAMASIRSLTKQGTAQGRSSRWVMLKKLYLK
jgi:hypothetical protein